MVWLYSGALVALVLIGYLFGRARAVAAGRKQTLHSRPTYYGAFVAIWILTPMVLTYAVGVAISPVPIIAVILMLFSAKARVNGPMFLSHDLI